MPQTQRAGGIAKGSTGSRASRFLGTLDGTRRNCPSYTVEVWQPLVTVGARTIDREVGRFEYRAKQSLSREAL